MYKNVLKTHHHNLINVKRSQASVNYTQCSVVFKTLSMHNMTIFFIIYLHSLKKNIFKMYMTYCRLHKSFNIISIYQILMSLPDFKAIYDFEHTYFDTIFKILVVSLSIFVAVIVFVKSCGYWKEAM